MRSSLLYSFLLIGLTFAFSTSRQLTRAGNVLPAASLQPLGRYYLTAGKELALVSSAAHVGFSFTGNKCKVFTSLANRDQHSYLQYTIDGVYKDKVRIEGNNDQPLIISASGKGPHSVWIYKATEAHTGPIFITKIEGEVVQSLLIKKTPLIEFIGNSITCGAAADASLVPCGTGEYHDQHNAYYAYGPRVARALNVNFFMSCVSGIGIYRNWNSDVPTMPEVYSKIDFTPGNTAEWNFNEVHPDIVSIALGTNDFSNGDGTRTRLAFDSSAFVNNYIRFVKQVKSKYPRAQIALLSSPMVHGKNRELLQHCISAVKQQIDFAFPSHKPVAVYFFEPMQAHGCSGHPSVEDHEILANELIPFFENLL